MKAGINPSSSQNIPNHLFPDITSPYILSPGFFLVDKSYLTKPNTPTIFLQFLEVSRKKNLHLPGNKRGQTQAMRV